MTVPMHYMLIVAGDSDLRSRRPSPFSPPFSPCLVSIAECIGCLTRDDTFLRDVVLNTFEILSFPALCFSFYTFTPKHMISPVRVI